MEVFRAPEGIHFSVHNALDDSCVIMKQVSDNVGEARFDSGLDLCDHLHDGHK